MFFYLSQLFSILLMPLSICLILIIYGFFRIKNKKGGHILIAGIVLLVFFSNKFISNGVMNAWELDFKVISTMPNYEIGIVLTGVTNLDKNTNDRTFFNKGADRATHAMQLYKLGKIKKILITGGQGFNPTNSHTEAAQLKDFMLIAGVDEKDIILEDQAKNTYQNAVFSKDILHNLGYSETQKHLLITSAFHMYRSKGCFEKAGLNTDAFPVDYYGYDSKFDLPHLFYPDPNAIFIWQKLFREWIGIVIYKLVGYL